MKRKELVFNLFLIYAGMAVAQSVPDVPEGYYTLTPFLQEAAGYVFSYDADALRNPYGNVADYANPLGKNGEYAYLYAVPSTSASLANSAFYFIQNQDGSYTIQSCSGEAHSYLDVALYDRRLVKFGLQPKRTFNLHGQSEDPASMAENEYVMQQVQNAALFESQASSSLGMGALQVLLPVDASKITPAFTIRRSMSDAKGMLALYRPGDNPGEVPSLLSSHLQELVDEAQALVAAKTTTEEQAEDIIQRLKEATASYAAVAPQHINPIQDGYYFLTSAYRAFELRQSKQKVLMAENTEDGSLLRWNNANTSDGSMAFRFSVHGEDFLMQDYRGRYVSHPSAESKSLTLLDNWDGATQLLNYDTEGLWTLADSSAPEDFFSAANPSVGERGLYGKPTDGDVVADGSMYLYPGYCSSWKVEKAFHQLTVTSTGWAAISVAFPTEVPADMEIYTVREADGELYLMPYSYKVIPARTAVVVHAPKGTYTFWSTTQEVPAVRGNALVANCEYLSGMESGSMATLKVKNGVVGFAKTTAKTLVAGSTYIPYIAGQDDFRPLKEDEDVIRALGESAGQLDNQQAYNLAGQRVNRTEKGLYIINNKKILK